MSTVLLLCIGDSKKGSVIKVGNSTQRRGSESYGVIVFTVDGPSVLLKAIASVMCRTGIVTENFAFTNKGNLP